MREFAYERAADLAGALAALAEPGTQPLAGGTELLNWLKEGIEEPDRLVDIGALPLDEVTASRSHLVLGGTARMSAVAAHPEAAAFPVLVQALLLGASPQLRNMATLGGNLQQRTRCPYFRAEHGELPCNKRTPGSGCAALMSGETERHALFGWTEECVATHPSDLAVALAALDAEIRTEDAAGGRRTLSAAEFHLTPQDAPPHRNTVLRPGELITQVRVPWGSATRRSRYVKVRERASYEFALVSAAVVLPRMEGGAFGSVRIALGGVAHRPWRLYAAEEALAGVGPDDVAGQRRALERSFDEARPLPGGRNAYKRELALRTALRALREAAYAEDGGGTATDRHTTDVGTTDRHTTDVGAADRHTTDSETVDRHTTDSEPDTGPDTGRGTGEGER
ncbi:FAD binding domain-containing protein [Streptomyces sp. ODS28]|uniref:FAD binding domain-containing protein n=1 Tax=Streptomyces sp. ODS28 TaxID=3136688 RepID=UPI0031EEEF63